MPDSHESVVRFHRTKPAKASPAGATNDGGGAPATPPDAPVREIGGRKEGLDPTRYGDWEKGGRCIDF